MFLISGDKQKKRVGKRNNSITRMRGARFSSVDELNDSLGDVMTLRDKIYQ